MDFEDDWRRAMERFLSVVDYVLVFKQLRFSDKQRYCKHVRLECAWNKMTNQFI